MENIVFYKIVVIATGVFLLIFNLHNISKKKMDIGIGSWWTIMALVIIVFGAIFDFSLLHHLVRFRNLMLIYMFAMSLVMALYIYGMHITRLKKRNDELAMWVSYAKSLADAKKTEEKTDENVKAVDDQ
ncbi:MAG: DUF2304 domain-containing protein [Ruminococcus sp.]|nr:DUF2304 domain-containing protein [Ruminococcus sp.]